MSHRYVMGVDPGVNGGIAFVRLDGTPMNALAMPARKVKGGNEIVLERIRTLVQCFGIGEIALVAIEKVGSMPTDSAGRAFRFGFFHGKVVGLVETLGLPLEMVTPQAWQKAILHGTSRDKGHAISFVKRRFPTMSLKATSRCTTDHDGIADALCLAEWARQRIVGVNDERSAM